MSHYHHVLAAMATVADETLLVSRYQLSTDTFTRLDRISAVPAPVRRLVQRRVSSALPGSVARRFLPPTQLAYPLAARLHLNVDGTLASRIHAGYCRSVQRASRGAALFHGIEGLSLRALTENEFQLSVVEARNFHHSVFASELDVQLGFPFKPTTNVLGDLQDAEYRAASKVLVYSSAVRDSFIRRGVASDSLVVAPLPIGQQLPRDPRPRDPRRLLYVGRGDAYKGLDLAVASTARIGRGTRLRVAGAVSKPVLDWLRRFPHVDYLGILNRTELRTEYESCWLMLAPSVESFGLAIAEAVHHGARVLCRETTGIAEYLPRDRVRIIPGRDLDGWRAAVEVELQGDRVELPTDAVPPRLRVDAAVDQLTSIYTSSM